MSSTERTELDIEHVDDDSADSWRSFVTDHPHATAFHTFAWKRAIEASFDYSQTFLFVTDSQTGERVAAVPGFTISGPLGSNVVNPFCEYGYPLIGDSVAAKSVLARLRDASPFSGPIIIKERELSGVQGYHRSSYAAVETGITFRLQTTASFDTVRERAFNRDLRKSVETAREHDLEVTVCNDIDAYYDLYTTTMARLGSPPFPRSLFAALAEFFEDRFRMRLVHDTGPPIAGLVTLEHNGTRYVLSNVSNSEYWEKRPNELLYYTMIEDACNGACSLVDFGRTEPDSTLSDFKRKFGGETARLMSFVYPPRYVTRASVSGYKRLEPLAKLFSPVIAHPTVGPKLKEWIHE